LAIHHDGGPKLRPARRFRTSEREGEGAAPTPPPRPYKIVRTPPAKRAAVKYISRCVAIVSDIYQEPIRTVALSIPRHDNDVLRTPKARRRHYYCMIKRRLHMLGDILCEFAPSRWVLASDGGKYSFVRIPHAHWSDTVERGSTAAAPSKLYPHLVAVCIVGGGCGSSGNIKAELNLRASNVIGREVYGPCAFFAYDEEASTVLSVTKHLFSIVMRRARDTVCSTIEAEVAAERDRVAEEEMRAEKKTAWRAAARRMKGLPFPGITVSC